MSRQAFFVLILLHHSVSQAGRRMMGGRATALAYVAEVK